MHQGWVKAYKACIRRQQTVKSHPDTQSVASPVLDTPTDRIGHNDRIDTALLRVARFVNTPANHPYRETKNAVFPKSARTQNQSTFGYFSRNEKNEWVDHCESPAHGAKLSMQLDSDLNKRRNDGQTKKFYHSYRFCEPGVCVNRG